MPSVVSRSSQSGEAARAAALQAEFNEKKWVWVPDEREGYVAGWVIREEDEVGEVAMASGGEVCLPSSCSFRRATHADLGNIDATYPAQCALKDEPT